MESEKENDFYRSSLPCPFATSLIFSADSHPFVLKI
jgi:hypothetical protein